MVKNKPKKQVGRENMMTDNLYEPFAGQKRGGGRGKGRGGSDHVQDYKYSGAPQRGGANPYGAP